MRRCNIAPSWRSRASICQIVRLAKGRLRTCYVPHLIYSHTTVVRAPAAHKALLRPVVPRGLFQVYAARRVLFHLPDMGPLSTNSSTPLHPIKALGSP